MRWDFGCKSDDFWKWVRATGIHELQAAKLGAVPKKLYSTPKPALDWTRKNLKNDRWCFRRISPRPPNWMKLSNGNIIYDYISIFYFLLGRDQKYVPELKSTTFLSTVLRTCALSAWGRFYRFLNAMYCIACAARNRAVCPRSTPQYMPEAGKSFKVQYSSKSISSCLTSFFLLLSCYW